MRLKHLLDVFHQIDGCVGVTFLLVQQAQLIHGKWYQVVVMLDVVFTANKKVKSKDTSVGQFSSECLYLHFSWAVTASLNDTQS